jgi:hypothetical protein
MKLRIISLATALALSSTCAFAQSSANGTSGSGAAPPAGSTATTGPMKWTPELGPMVAEVKV